VKFHEIFVAQFSHDLNLIDEGFFAEFLLVGSFLRECLHRIFGIILMFDYQIDGSKISLADLFNRFKKLVKTS
jgi:hypothetical protein